MSPFLDIYDLSVHVSSEYDPLYVQNLCNKMQATQQLVSAFVQLGGKAQAPLLKDEMYRRCQRAQTEVCFMAYQHTRLWIRPSLV